MSGPIYNAVRNSSQASGANVANPQSSPTSTTFSEQKRVLTKTDLRGATKARKGFAIFTSVLFFITLVFLILIQIGNLSNRHVLGDLYFFKIDIANLVPNGQAKSKQLNAAAKAAGLHDFYQVGLWNFCEGYYGRGITACSKPQLMYWFNPVQILIDELLGGKAVTLPIKVVQYLTIIRGASRVMFVCFFSSTFTSFILIFIAPLAVYSRLTSIPIVIFALISALMTFIATGVATGMWLVFRQQILANVGSDFNVIPTLGLKMFVFCWIAAGCSLFAAIGQIGMLCCGTSRRDIKTGRRVGRKQRTEGTVAIEENPALRRRWWGSVSE